MAVEKNGVFYCRHLIPHTDSCYKCRRKTGTVSVGSMVWDNLKKGLCPMRDCGGMLKIETSGLVTCEINGCDFGVRLSKYKELIKPRKESTQYKNKVAKFKKIKEYNKKIDTSIQVNINERHSNLRRMLAKGTITQEEYNQKMI